MRRYITGKGFMLKINMGDCEPAPEFQEIMEPPEECLRGILPYLNPRFTNSLTGGVLWCSRDECPARWCRSLAHAKRVCQLWSMEVHVFSVLLPRGGRYDS